ncbi:MAG TPA: Gfo/Idh/MocA family oxidoreductase [Opitutaceae bacterium]
MNKLKVAGLNFDHMHMGDLLRKCHDHPDVEIVGICDAEPARMRGAIANFSIPPEQVFTDPDRCLEATRPDFVILCPATGDHATYVERVARHRVHMLVEKPFAATVRDADRMIAAARRARRQLAINWPLRWYPTHVTAHRLVHEGRIGTLQEVHYYDGNRGPLWHAADKIETSPTPSMKRKSWFYKRDRGGGSLLDYLGYGVTLATWFNGGQKPAEVTAVVDQPPHLEVDEHSVTIARYRNGLSKFETRWGTFTDPWTLQPQPKCGFVLKGDAGTISSYDYDSTVRVQTPELPAGADLPVDTLEAPFRGPIEYFVHCLRTRTPVDGPLSPRMARIGQQIVDSAILSARRKRTVPLVP